MAKKYLPLILILWFAFALRTHQLTAIPPGLTHDEANHGRDSINILDGVLLFYFPLNYGSEPFYNYVVAGSMALVGENLFALRLVNVMFGLLAIAAVYLWANWAFDRRSALITASLVAVSFWPLASSRQALRAGMLPFLATAAALFFWLIFRWGQKAGEHHKPQNRQALWWAVLGFAVCVAATLHAYLAARVLWLMYPLFLAYLAFAHRPLFRAIWRPVLAGLILAMLLVLPMFAYVQAHPEAETRLQMLDGPLQSLSSGQLGPVLANAQEALLAFLWPGFGDHFLAYNIPGRPVLEVLTALFFLAGLVVTLLCWKKPAYAFVLIWFVTGILPSLVTGPEANTTRNLGALPPTYILPALGFVAVFRAAIKQWGRPARAAAAAALALWLILAGAVSVGDYFIRWAQSPDVRAAYQHTLGEALDYLTGLPDREPVVISSVYPGAAHDPSIARVLAPEMSDLRWIDARFAMIFPSGQGAQLVLPSSTPLNPAFEHLTRPLETVNLRPDDLDPSFSFYELQAAAWDWPDKPLNFGNALYLLGGRWLEDSVAPGEVAQLLTAWQVIEPSKVGPIVPPAFETDVLLFTHVLDASGNILTQRDALEAPSWDWQAGDILLQVHPVNVPTETQPGTYETVVGVYDRASGDRLPLLDSAGEIVDSSAFVVPLTVDER